MIAFDTETYRFSPGNMAPKVICLSFQEPNQEPELIKADPRLHVELGLIINQEHFVGHHAAYDMACIASTWPQLLPYIYQAYDEKRVTCTLVRERLLNIATEGHCPRTKGYYSLAGLAKRYLNEDLDKNTWRTHYDELAETPLSAWPAGAVEYAKNDARTTYWAWQCQDNRAVLLRDDREQSAAAFWLHMCSVWGIRTDLRAVQELQKNAQSDLAEATKFLEKEGLLEKVMKGRGKNKQWTGKYKKNQKKMQTIVVDLSPGHPTTDTGKTSLATEHLESIDNQIVIAYSKYCSADRDRAYLETLERGTKEPIHARFTTVLETGRTSATDRLQNPPRSGGFRECFVPRPGYIFADADYSGLELAAFAQVCIDKLGYSRMGDAINTGRDLHTLVASRFLNIPYEEGVRRKKEEGPNFIAMRHTAKGFNFGRLAAMGYKAFMAYSGLDLTEGEFDRLAALQIEEFPEMAEYWNWVQRSNSWAEQKRQFRGKEIQKKLTVEPVEHLRSRRFRAKCSFTQAANTLFQGLAADGAKRAGFLLSRECYTDSKSALFGSRIVNFVHDQFLLEVPKNHADEALDRLIETMCKGMSEYIPDVKISAEGSLKERWSK